MDTRKLCSAISSSVLPSQLGGIADTFVFITPAVPDLLDVILAFSEGEYRRIRTHTVLPCLQLAIMNEHQVGLGESTCFAKFPGRNPGILNIIDLGHIALERASAPGSPEPRPVSHVGGIL